MVINSRDDTWLKSERLHSVYLKIRFEKSLIHSRLSRNQKPPLVIRYPPQIFRQDFRESPLLPGFSARITAAWVNMAVRTWGQEYKVIPEITGLLCQKITSGRGCQLAPWGSGPLSLPPALPALYTHVLAFVAATTAVQPNNRSLLSTFFTDLFYSIVAKSNIFLFSWAIFIHKIICKV